jgi:hypothetical protein
MSEQVKFECNFKNVNEEEMGWLKHYVEHKTSNPISEAEEVLGEKTLNLVFYSSRGGNWSTKNVLDYIFEDYLKKNSHIEAEFRFLYISYIPQGHYNFNTQEYVEEEF